MPVIGFPRGATQAGYQDYIAQVPVPGLAIDTETDADWAARVLQPKTCVQGNLDQRLLVSGGDRLVEETKRVVRTFAGGPHIFNLGHGITPDADPENVQLMIDTVRERR